MHAVDVVILGSGFAGSLLGLILQRQGMSVLIIDRARHPRFAIGESSTPSADYILEDLCERYQLHSLRPLCRYGTWCREQPHISRGLKRGFSYFHHQAGNTFSSGNDHANELLVAASANDDVGDTHWYRADVDQFIARRFVCEGGELWEGTTVREAKNGSTWTLNVDRPDGAEAVQAGFLVDGTGGDSALVKWLNLATSTQELKTNSRAIFSHFRGVSLWTDCLNRWGIDQTHYPYPCDLAALHHVIEGGWMWCLRFDNGITSLGWSLDRSKHPAAASLTPLQEWNLLLDRYPSVAEYVREAAPAPPFSGQEDPLIRTGRLQRLIGHASGSNWVLLPHTAGFVDPFYSTGIAHSLLGVERLSQIIPSLADRTERLTEYSAALTREIRLVDQLVSLAFRGMGGEPELLHAASMLYFAAATSFEARRRSGGKGDFLLADEPQFNAIVRNLDRCYPGNPGDSSQAIRWVNQVRHSITPWNQVGLFQPRHPHMYWHTAAEK